RRTWRRRRAPRAAPPRPPRAPSWPARAWRSTTWRRPSSPRCARRSRPCTTGPGSSGATPTSPRWSRRPAAGRGRFPVRVGIGRTFTDIVFLDDDGTVHTKKVSSSVDDYARAIVEGVRELFHETGVSGHDVSEVLHGTTVASNAILELRGAR